uniref:Transmembrane protein 131-like N-terminal domain-containing protein n=1 Tax=Schistocephalus solidus TaxID=70667 RepID=A0A0X3NLI1_SCHSO
MATVTVTNILPDRSLDLLSMHTSEFILLFKPTQLTILEAGQTMPLTLLLIPNKIGHIEAELHVETTAGSAKCKVYGYSSRSKFNLRALQAKKLSTSSTYRFSLMFLNPHPFPLQISEVRLTGSNLIQSEENPSLFSATERFHPDTFDLQTKSPVIIVEGQQEKTICSLEFCSAEALTIQGFITATVATSTEAAANSFDNPKVSTSRTSIQLSSFIIPVNLNVTHTRNFHILEECLDFGVLRSSDSPKSLGLTAYNTLHEPVSISITAEEKGEFVHIQHDAAVFPDRSFRGVKIASVTFDPSSASKTGYVSGLLNIHASVQSEPLFIEFKAFVIKGSLYFNTSLLTFFCGDQTLETRPLLTAGVSMSNQFDFSLGLYGYRLPPALSDAFEIKGLPRTIIWMPPSTVINFTITFRPSQKTACHPQLFNITVFSNVSAFLLPAALYTGRLEITSVEADDNEDSLDFGFLEAGHEHVFGIYLMNPNPVPVRVRQLQLYTPEKMYCLDLARQLPSPTACRGHVAQAPSPSASHCTSSSLSLGPSEWALFPLSLHHAKADSVITWTLTADSDIVSTSKSLHFRVSLGRISGKPEVLHLGSSFVGKSVFRNLLVHNSYSRPVELASVSLRSHLSSAFPRASLNLGLPRFRIELGGHTTSSSTPINASFAPQDTHLAVSINLEPRRTTLVGSVFFDMSDTCRDALSDTIDFRTHLPLFSPDWPVCYTGFDLTSEKGRFWFSSLWFTFSRDQGVFAPHPRIGSSGTIFVNGLRFSSSLFTELYSAWRTLRMNVLNLTTGAVDSDVAVLPIADPSPDQRSLTYQPDKLEDRSCYLPGRVVFSTHKASFFNQISAELIWPSLLTNRISAGVTSTGGGGTKKTHKNKFDGVATSTSDGGGGGGGGTSTPLCELTFDLADRLLGRSRRRENLALSALAPSRIAEMTLRNLPSQQVVCKFTVSNPSDRPVLLQPLLLDALLPESVEVGEMNSALKTLVPNFLKIINLPFESNHYMSQGATTRNGRFYLHVNSAPVSEASLTALRYLTNLSGLSHVVIPTCCPVFILPPNGGEAVFSISYTLGNFSRSAGTDSSARVVTPLDKSILLLRNNLTSLEPVLIRALTMRASFSLLSSTAPPSMSQAYPSSLLSQSLKGDGTPAAAPSGQAMLLFNPDAVPFCRHNFSLGLPLGHYELHEFADNNGVGYDKGSCFFDAKTARNTSKTVSFCRLSSGQSTTSPALLTFDLYEALLNSLCNGDVQYPQTPVFSHWENPRVSVVGVSDFPAGGDAISPEQPLLAASGLVDSGEPIFPPEFVSGLTLMRRLALLNDGSLPVWILRVGLCPLSATAMEDPLASCLPQRTGFSVSICQETGEEPVDAAAASDSFLPEFELKPGERRWLEILYAPDFLHPRVHARLCVFAAIQPLRNAAGGGGGNATPAEPASSNARSTVPRNSSGIADFTIFQLEPVDLVARISPALNAKCHATLLRPSFEDSLWLVLVCILVINLTGILFAAFFESRRLLALYEQAHPYTSVPTSTTNSRLTDVTSTATNFASGLINRNFNLPIFGCSSDLQQTTRRSEEGTAVAASLGFLAFRSLDLPSSSSMTGCFRSRHFMQAPTQSADSFHPSKQATTNSAICRRLLDQPSASFGSVVVSTAASAGRVLGSLLLTLFNIMRSTTKSAAVAATSACPAGVPLRRRSSAVEASQQQHGGDAETRVRREVNENDLQASRSGSGKKAQDYVAAAAVEAAASGDRSRRTSLGLGDVLGPRKTRQGIVKQGSDASDKSQTQSSASSISGVLQSGNRSNRQHITRAPNEAPATKGTSDPPLRTSKSDAPKEKSNKNNSCNPNPETIVSISRSIEAAGKAADSITNSPKARLHKSTAAVPAEAPKTSVSHPPLFLESINVDSASRRLIKSKRVKANVSSQQSHLETSLFSAAKVSASPTPPATSPKPQKTLSSFSRIVPREPQGKNSSSVNASENRNLQSAASKKTSSSSLPASQSKVPTNQQQQQQQQQIILNKPTTLYWHTASLLASPSVHAGEDAQGLDSNQSHRPYRVQINTNMPPPVLQKFLGGPTGSLHSVDKGYAERPMTTTINDVDFPLLSEAAEVPRRVKSSLIPSAPHSADYDNRHSFGMSESEKGPYPGRCWPLFYSGRNRVFFPPTYPMDYPDPYSVPYDATTFQPTYQVLETADGGSGGGLYQFIRPSSYDSSEDQMSELRSLLPSTVEPFSQHSSSLWRGTPQSPPGVFHIHRRRRSSTGQIAQEPFQSNRSDLPLFLLSQSTSDLASDSAVHPELSEATQQTDISKFSPTSLDSNGDGGGDELQSFTLARRQRMLNHESRKHNKVLCGDKAFLSDLHLAGGQSRYKAQNFSSNAHDRVAAALAEDEALLTRAMRESDSLQSSSCNDGLLIFRDAIGGDTLPLTDDLASVPVPSTTDYFLDCQDDFWSSTAFPLTLGDDGVHNTQDSAVTVFGGVKLGAWPPAAMAWPQQSFESSNEHTHRQFRNVWPGEEELEYRPRLAPMRGADRHSAQKQIANVSPIGSSAAKRQQAPSEAVSSSDLMTDHGDTDVDLSSRPRMSV